MSNRLTLKELASFHSIDIQAVARLVKNLSFHPNRAKKIVAFWLLLERQGNPHFIKNILSWSMISFREAALEADKCLQFLRLGVYSEGYVYHNFIAHIKLLSSLIDRDFIFSRETRTNAMAYMERIEKNVLDRLLQCIFPRDVADVSQIGLAKAGGGELIWDSWIRGGQEDNVRNHDLPSVLIRSKGLLITSLEDHHFTKEELEDFFRRRHWGVEAVLVDLHTRPWFALVVCIFPSKPKAIARGTSPEMLSINGKIAFARRYNPSDVEMSKGARMSILG